MSRLARKLKRAAIRLIHANGASAVVEHADGKRSECTCTITPNDKAGQDGVIHHSHTAYITPTSREPKVNDYLVVGPQKRRFNIASVKFEDPDLTGAIYYALGINQ